MTLLFNRFVFVQVGSVVHLCQYRHFQHAAGRPSVMMCGDFEKGEIYAAKLPPVRDLKTCSDCFTVFLPAL